MTTQKIRIWKHSHSSNTESTMDAKDSLSSCTQPYF